MKLDINCIRDILLYVEDNTTFFKEINFSIHSIPCDLQKYNVDKLFYHLRYCDEAEFFTEYALLEESEIEIRDLTVLGHEFISNIKDENNFDKLKEAMLKCGTKAIGVAVTLATEIAFKHIFD